jgi:exodeoxyribonuclease VII large subunit
MRQDLHARDVRLRGAVRAGIASRQRDLERLRGALSLHSPLRAIPLQRERLAGRAEKMSALMRLLIAGRRRELAARDRLGGDVGALLATRRRHLQGVGARLDALSPLRVIERGYSITVDAASGRVLTSAAGIAPGAHLRTRLAAGSLVSEVLPGGVEGPIGAERTYDDRPGQRATSEDPHG